MTLLAALFGVLWQVFPFPGPGVSGGGAPTITPPTFVSYTATASWVTNTTSTTTASISVQTGDLMVGYTMTEANTTTTAISDSGSGTWTLAQANSVASNCYDAIWTRPVTATTTYTVTFTRTGSGVYGGAVIVFRGSGGVGASSKTTNTGAPTLNITTGQAHSAVVVVNGDWNAVDGTSRTWRTNAGTIFEQTYTRNASFYTGYAAFHSNAASATTYAVGLSAPTGQAYAILALEVKGQ